MTIQSHAQRALGFALCIGLFFAAPLLAGTSVEQDANGVRITTHEGVIILRPLTENAMRVRFSVREAADETSNILQLGNLPSVNFSVSETPESVIVRTPKMYAAVERATGLISYYDAYGNLLVAEKPASRIVRASTIDTEPCMIVGQTFLTAPDEKLYGTGQFQDDNIVINNLQRRLLQINTQISIPFVLSSKGYGILWHNTGMTEFNLAEGRITAFKSQDTKKTVTVEDLSEGVTSKRQLKVLSHTGSFTATATGRYGILLEGGSDKKSAASMELDGKPFLAKAGYVFTDLKAGKHTFKITASGGTPSIYVRPVANEFSFGSPVADAIDYVVFAGPDPDDVIAAYRQCTGAAPLLPRWAYGYIQCRDRYENQQQLLDTIAGFRTRGIPMDVIVQDWKYWGSYGWNALRFDEKLYPDPAEMARKAHEANARIMISMWSKIGLMTEAGTEFSARNYFIKGTNWVDYFNPDAGAYMWENIDRNFNSIGIDGWWLDATEPENDDLHGRHVFTGSGDRVRLMYPLMASKAVYEGQRISSPEKRVFILTRSAFAGQQRYASAVWSGDIDSNWETLRRQIPAGLNYMACGLPYWTTDCGGFWREKTQYTDKAFHELFIRWLQFSTFCPLQRVHGFQSNTELWNYGEAVQKESWRWLYLRYRMLPYNYSTAADVTFNGASMMRPLVMDFADDPTALEQKYEYLYGKSFLVAPVVQPGVTKWSVYLPKNAAGWYEFFYGQQYAGGQSVVLNVALDTLPLFVKGGSIVPLGPVKVYTGEKSDNPIELRVYPGADAEFTLYEDDGLSYGYEQGQFTTIKLSWDDKSGTLTIGARNGSFDGMLKIRTFKIVRVGAGITPVDDSSTATVIYDGKELNVKL